MIRHKPKGGVQVRPKSAEIKKEAGGSPETGPMTKQQIPNRLTPHATRNQAGFTLIEIVIIITVLGILAAISMPSFQDIGSQAKISATKQSLMSMRSAISGWNSGSIVRGTGNVWPTRDSVATAGVVLSGVVPINSFQLSANAPDSVVTGVTKGVIVGTRGGWAYKPSTGEIWPNTNSTIPGSGCSGSVAVGENSW